MKTVWVEYKVNKTRRLLTLIIAAVTRLQSVPCVLRAVYHGSGCTMQEMEQFSLHTIICFAYLYKLVKTVAFHQCTKFLKTDLKIIGNYIRQKIFLVWIFKMNLFFKIKAATIQFYMSFTVCFQCQYIITEPLFLSTVEPLISNPHRTRPQSKHNKFCIGEKINTFENSTYIRRKTCI